MASLVFGKGVCTFISCNSSMIFDLIKEGVGLRATDDIRGNFENGLLGNGDRAPLGTTLVS